MLILKLQLSIYYLNPNLGVANYNKEITIADIPGLVEGAHKGTGLGIQF